MTGSPESALDHRAAFVSFALLSGVMTGVLLIVVARAFPHAAAEQAALAHRQPLLILLGVTTLAWVVTSAPFVATLGRLLEPRGVVMAQSATLLSIGGILLFAFAVFARVGAFMSILAAGNALTPAEARGQMAIWGSLSFYLADPGLMTWGLGQFLFGWLARQSEAMPPWLAVVGMVGGLAGLLTLATYQSALLALIQLAAFGLWGFAVGARLLRT